MPRLWKCAAIAPFTIGALVVGLLLPVSVAAADQPGPPGLHHHHGFSITHGHHGFFHGHTYDCTGGTVPPGTYYSIVVTGLCYMPIGNITVQGNVTVAPGALLDAVTKGDPSTHPVVPADVNIGGNVSVSPGAVLLFGCSPNITCTSPPGITYDRIQGSLMAFGAQGVVVHSATIGGNLTIVGGGGGAAAETCNAVTTTRGIPPLPTLQPWSEDPGINFIPVYTDVEDSTIGGNYTITGLTSCWLGTIADQVGGNVTVANNTMGDPDAMEINTNLVNGNLTCFGNSPAVQFGDSHGTPNVVGGYGAGECGFNVVKPNPRLNPPTTPVAGITEHIAVSTRTLGFSTGTYTATPPAFSLPPVTTSAGDTLIAQTGNFTIAGTGVTGSGTFTPTELGHSGEVFLGTLYPNGSASFTVDIYCQCSFAGQTFPTLIRAYGTTTRHGYTSGTFIIYSGGGTTPTDSSGLVGYGTFNNAGEPTGSVRLFEHLAAVT